MALIPMVVERTHDGERSYDLVSRLMKDRIIMINSGIDSSVAHVVSAQLLYLESQDSEKPIYMYINSPGGSVHDGLQIADTMNIIRNDVVTICSGIGASFGCYLTAIGAPGKRYMTEHAQLMAHQVSAGSQGHIEDMRVSFKHTDKLNTLLMTNLSNIVGIDHNTLMRDCERDKWMGAREARDYGKNGFVDGVILGKTKEGKLKVEQRGNKVVEL